MFTPGMVLTGMLPPFCSIMSSCRKTFEPSAFTSMEKLCGFADPLILFHTTPMRERASSPLLRAYLEVLSRIGFASALTVLAVSAAFEDMPTLAEGSGSGHGAARVVHTVAAAR